MRSGSEVSGTVEDDFHNVERQNGHLPMFSSTDVQPVATDVLREASVSGSDPHDSLSVSDNIMHVQQHDALAAPDVVRVSRDLTFDGVPFQRWARIAGHAATPLYFAIKIALLVALPLLVLVYSSPTGHHFQSRSLMAVLGVGNTALYVGQQINMAIIIYQASIWMMIWGVIITLIGIVHNEAAWWCLAFTAMLFVSFFTNLRSRYMLMNFTMIIMLIQRIPGNDVALKPVRVASNIMLGVTFSVLQSFLPYPLLMSNKTNVVIASSFAEVGKIARQLRDGVWSGRAFSGYVSASLSACDELATVIDGIPELLHLCSFEIFERSLWNQLRRKRLLLLKRLLVILYATCTSAQLVTSMTTVQTRESSAQWKRILKIPIDEYLDALENTTKLLGDSLEPRETVARCRFAELQEKKDDVLKAIQDSRSWASRNTAESTNAAAFYSFLYFHLMLALLSEEMRTFAEQMDAFDPKDYKSTWRRLLEFFVLDFWNDFRFHLLNRFLLRTEEARRSLKDAFKLACAYCVAAAFLIKMDGDNTEDSYYFGTSIILGIGLPTTSETIVVGIHRICGMALGITFGYLARWKTNTFAQAIAVMVCGIFLIACFRCNRRYMHVAWYGSFIVPAAYGISTQRSTMIMKVVDTIFTVFAYFLICTLVFPLNPFRVLWNYRALVEKCIADTITQLSSIAQLPVDEEHGDIAEARMQIVQDNLTRIKDTLASSKRWIGICANEPVVFGNAFPTDRVTSVHVWLVHITAALEMWLFGLQILFRARGAAPHVIIQRMMRALVPILRDIEGASRVIFQELIDCVDAPLQWAPMHSVQHLSDFVEIKSRFSLIFQQVHKEMMRTYDHGMRRKMFKDASAVRKRSAGNASTSLPAVYCDNSLEVYSADLVEYRREPVYTASDGSYIDGTAADKTNVTLVGGVPSVASAGPLIASRHLSFGLRVPPGSLPIDIDITAYTFTIVSISMILSAVEVIVPHMHVFNAFERSRLRRGKVSIKEFYRCGR